MPTAGDPLTHLRQRGWTAFAQFYHGPEEVDVHADRLDASHTQAALRLIV